MSPRTAAATVMRSAAATVHAPARTRPARRPAPQRRRSGAAVPRTRTLARPRFDFVTVLDRLLRGPAYIAMVGILLVGIVFFNVDVLQLNHGIASTDVASSQLKRENATLMLRLAKLGSSERIQQVALDRGMVLPQPGDVRYLRAHPGDAARALRVMTAPDATTAAPLTAALVTQQSTPTTGSATTATPTTTTPTTTSTPATTAPVTTTPTTTTQTTPTMQTAPTQTVPATTAPATSAGATAAPATTAQTTP